MLNCTKEIPHLLFGGVEIVYIFGCVVNQSALWFTSEQQVFLALRPVLLNLRTSRLPIRLKAVSSDVSLPSEIPNRGNDRRRGRQPSFYGFFRAGSPGSE